MNKNSKILLTLVSFMFFGGVLVYWANSDLPQKVGIDKASTSFIVITIGAFFAVLYHVRILENLVYGQERLSEDKQKSSDGSE